MPDSGKSEDPGGFRIDFQINRQATVEKGSVQDEHGQMNIRRSVGAVSDHRQDDTRSSIFI
ncbi:hypothetical protein ACFOD7_02915 [Paracoccus fontiphilus]|uniref:Uncharacterized protein n=1 Tax=Paracoccus fontiphilus TaxID=1815556 RepID=A0ABV7I8N5_9RHOB